ncbi:MAG TPA: alkaline phosphatase family protein [Verrucomicrobiae bacterium]|nr:alkaline phosphatase family protein [Verrucomicrobiae bacterium]
MMHLLLAALSALGGPIAGSPISHVIVIVQENRTMDDLFASSVLANGGPFPGANVTQTATIDGKPVPMHAVPFEYPADPLHSHISLVHEWDNGKMDGFSSVHVTPNEGYPVPPAGFALAYLPDYETTIYHYLAHRYALADMNFAPRLIPTFPSHVFLIAAQSQFAGNPTDGIVWGCDSKPGTTALLFGAGEDIQTPGIFPCVDDPTIGDLLDRAHVSWKYYTGAIGNVVDGQINVYDAIKHMRYGLDWSRNISTPATNILSDIQNCALPSVSYVTPEWLASDHAGNLSAGGPGWVGAIYLAVAQSALAKVMGCNYYANTAIVLTWDDSGGWYDHVAPPPGPDGTTHGFRIPILAISAWSKSGYVSHTVRESTSIVRFIERNWALGDLGQRDATDDDLSDMFDYARAAPVPPFGRELVDLVKATHIDLVALAHDNHPVDDDR